MKKKREFTPAQLQAIEHTDSDLLVSAGAGSGKTATLIERITRKIIAGADIAKMLVVTFTKEAANELKSRLISELEDTLRLANIDKSLNINAEHVSSQIFNISSADISTIDSFCYHIVKPSFDKVGLDADFRIGNDGELSILEFEAMKEVIDEFYNENEPDKDFLCVVDCFSSFSDEEKLADNLLKLYKNLSNTSDFLETLIMPIHISGDFMDSRYAVVLKQAILELSSYYKKIFEDFADEIKYDTDAIDKYQPSIDYDLAFIDSMINGVSKSKYSELYNVFNSFKPISIGRKSAPLINSDFYKTMKGKFAEAVRKYAKLYFCSDEASVKASAVQNERICQALYKVLTKFHEEYRKKKSQLSVCTFNDISRYALKLLYNDDGSRSDIAIELRKKYKEIYIDEYQDTNSVQDRIFQAISNNNRFMVGDIKQSIYKFRYAEPEIFMHYRNSFIDKDLPCSDSKHGRSIFMSSNFRCNPEIIDFTNMLSNHMFRNSDGISYNSKDDLEVRKTDGRSPNKEPCELMLVDISEKEENPEACEGVQAELIAQKIKILLDRKKLPYGKEIKKSDIAILLRSTKTSAQPYIDALSRYGIGSSYKADVGFYEKPHILLMLCLLNSIDNPYNDTYMAGCMCSDIFNFTLDDLIKIRASAKNKKEPLYQSATTYKNDEDICKKINALTKSLDSYRATIRKMSAHDAIASIMSETRILSMCSSEERRDLLKFYNIAREFEGSSFKGVYKFLRYIDGNIETELREEVGKEDTVKIMTIHASKGLEFEYCFVCNLESEMTKRGEKPSLLFDRFLGVAGHVSYDGDIAKFNTLIRKCVDLSSSRQAKEEEMRILYVAFTRAKTRLYLCAELDSPNERHNTSIKKFPYVSNYSLYKTVKRIDFILDALDCDKPFIEKTIYLPEYIWDKKLFDEEEERKRLEESNDTTNEEEKSKKEPKIYTQKDYEDILSRRFGFKYEKEYLNKLPSKISISKIKAKMLDNDENSEVNLDTSLDVFPKFLPKTAEENSATEKGTATHVFLQFCDFERLQEIGYEKERDLLTKEHFISEQNSELINGEDIEKFVKTPLFLSMLDSIKNKRMVKREFRFNYMLEIGELSSDERLKKEKVLVQGVLDCIYENENHELILIDYKTDNVTEENYKWLLKKRHSTQLSYYKKACEEIFDRPISKAIIYSIPLGKTVEV
ncbi:MAG: UvrD-helicase domain-containing protein [Clostridia bacterium]|nr:UvrD-helicase domain-containing protein [Clostridia bacterium]